LAGVECRYNPTLKLADALFNLFIAAVNWREPFEIRSDEPYCHFMMVAWVWIKTLQMLSVFSLSTWVLNLKNPTFSKYLEAHSTSEGRSKVDEFDFVN
jgi:hypothetical protein